MANKFGSNTEDASDINLYNRKVPFNMNVYRQLLRIQATALFNAEGEYRPFISEVEMYRDMLEPYMDNKRYEEVLKRYKKAIMYVLQEQKYTKQEIASESDKINYLISRKKFKELQNIASNSMMLPEGYFVEDV